MQQRAFFLSAVLVLFACACSGFVKEKQGQGESIIVQDGIGRAAIVVQRSPSDSAQRQKERYDEKVLFPAKELQVYVEKMSGAKLPIFTEGDTIPETCKVVIFVGNTDAARKAGIKILSTFNPRIRPDIYEEEGYVVRITPSQIFLTGNQAGPYHGTTYAVYSFLEKLGCRWYFPGEWGQIVPEKKTVAAPVLDIEAKPDFAMRGIWLDGRWGLSTANREVYRIWCGRVGFSGDYMSNDKLYPIPGDGYLAWPIPPKEYAVSHPEYFAMDKSGKRDISPNTYPSYTMLCLSNKEMQAEYIKNVKEAFEGKSKLYLPNISDIGIGISPPDGTPYCYCDTCLAQSQNFNYPTYIHERMQSEEVFGFACKLADTFPDKWVSVSAYALREMPPQGVKLRPNMSVMYAPISCCVLHPNNDPSCWRRSEMMSILKQWCRQCAHVWLYDYTPGLLVSGFVPERDVANFAVNAPIYKEIGLKGFGRQGSNTMMATWISYYTAAKLMWDVHADVEAIKKDFYTNFFGQQAGLFIQAWWDACESELAKSRVHVHEDWLINHIYTAEFARSIHKYVEAARSAQMTPAQKERFKIFQLIVENFEAWTQMFEADKNMEYRRSSECAGRMLEAQKQLCEISEFLVGKGALTNTWECYTKGRQIRYAKLAGMTDGETGLLVAPVPITAKFCRDRFNEGVIGEWYARDFDDRNWKAENTFYLWDQQDEPEDASGHDYDGYGWYRMEIQIPSKWKGRPIHFFCGGAINEAWVWINGQYAGHKNHAIWWMGGHDFDLDVTSLARPGEKNVVAIRIWNNAELGGLYRRGFFWSPK